MKVRRRRGTPIEVLESVGEPTMLSGIARLLLKQLEYLKTASDDEKRAWEAELEAERQREGTGSSRSENERDEAPRAKVSAGRGGLTGLHLTREELVDLTGKSQPKRMCDWLTNRNWIFEAPDRRGGIPKVARAYWEARMTGRPLEGKPRRIEPNFDGIFD